MVKFSESVCRRFEQYTEYEPNTGCLLWSAATYSGGYGMLSVDYKTTFAHRISYLMHKGPIPMGMIIRHKCDTPQCCNPDHLEIGTPSDNSKDAVKRGRSRKPGMRCSQGHIFKSNTTYFYKSKGKPARRCKICMVLKGIIFNGKHQIKPIPCPKEEIVWQLSFLRK